MYKKDTVLNPALPSPWTSNAPLGYHPLFRKPSPQRVVKASIGKGPSSRKIKFMLDSAIFRNLNKNTLVLLFPDISEEQIDNTLIACDNNLSETIQTLNSRNIQTTNIIQPNDISLKLDSFTPRTTGTQNQSSNEVTYIPTKYEDVQIVEGNQPSTSRIHSNHLYNSQDNRINTSTSFLRLAPLPPPPLPKFVQQVHTGYVSPIVSVPPILLQSPSTYTIPARTEVENITEQHHNTLSDPNQILERALTFFPSFSQD